jgi:hypothetical protein
MLLELQIFAFFQLPDRVPNRSLLPNLYCQPFSSCVFCSYTLAIILDLNCYLYYVIQAHTLGVTVLVNPVFMVIVILAQFNASVAEM